MFDFTDFNSAHTLESQKCVVREVFAGLDHEWLDWMLHSIDWMWIRQDDDTWRRVTGTLMSGHRLTSLINTVLNAAYTRLALCEALYSRITVEHVGDDIVMSTDCADTITDIVIAMLQSGLRLQVDKQSCGEINAEFLRNCYNGAVCLGYVCRSVASLVSGSWVSENALGTREYAQSLYTALWNANNRSLGVSRVGLVAVSSCMRRVGLSRSNAESFCTQRCVIGSGPAMLGDGPLIRITFSQSRIDCTDIGASKRKGRYKAHNGVRLPRNATTDYIQTCKDVALLAHTGVGRAAVANVMLEATYGNLVDTGKHFVTKYRVDHPNENSLPIYKSREASWNNWRRFKPLGAVVHMLIPGISVGQVRALGMLMGRDTSDVLLPRGSNFATVRGRICSSDAQAFSGFGARGYIAETCYPVFV